MLHIKEKKNAVLRLLLACVLVCSFLFANAVQHVLAAENLSGSSTIKGKLTITPATGLETGQKVTIKGTFPNKGELSKDAVFTLDQPFKNVQVQNVQTVVTKDQYEITGILTPTEKGKYTVRVSITMKDKKGKNITGKASKIFTVEEGWIYYFFRDIENSYYEYMYRDKMDGANPEKITKSRNFAGKIYDATDGVYFLSVADPEIIGGLAR